VTGIVYGLLPGSSLFSVLGTQLSSFTHNLMRKTIWKFFVSLIFYKVTKLLVFFSAKNFLFIKSV